MCEKLPGPFCSGTGEWKAGSGLKTAGTGARTAQQYLVSRWHGLVTLDQQITKPGPSSKHRLGSRLHLRWCSPRAARVFARNSELGESQGLAAGLSRTSSSSELSTSAWRGASSGPEARGVGGALISHGALVARRGSAHSRA